MSGSAIQVLNLDSALRRAAGCTIKFSDTEWDIAIDTKFKYKFSTHMILRDRYTQPSRSARYGRTVRVRFMMSMGTPEIHTCRYTSGSIIAIRS
eukprot:SAG31_NODE_844_length_11549_cov_2.985852_6_plen_94_part_00